jgi:hypothetical protein
MGKIILDSIDQWLGRLQVGSRLIKEMMSFRKYQSTGVRFCCTLELYGDRSLFLGDRVPMRSSPGFGD